MIFLNFTNKWAGCFLVTRAGYEHRKSPMELHKNSLWRTWYPDTYLTVRISWPVIPGWITRMIYPDTHSGHPDIPTKGWLVIRMNLTVRISCRPCSIGIIRFDRRNDITGLYTIQQISRYPEVIFTWLPGFLVGPSPYSTGIRRLDHRNGWI